MNYEFELNLYEYYPNLKKMIEYNHDNYDYIAQTYELSFMIKNDKDKYVKTTINASIALFLDYHDNNFNISFDIVPPDELTVFNTHRDVSKNLLTNKHTKVTIEKKDFIKLKKTFSYPINDKKSLQENINEFLSTVYESHIHKMNQFCIDNNIPIENDSVTSNDIKQHFYDFYTNMKHHISEQNFHNVKDPYLLKKLLAISLEGSLKSNDTFDFNKKHKI